MKVLLFLFKLVKNKYAMTTLLFFAIMGFLDKNSWMKRIEHKQEIYRLEKEIKKYEEQRDRDSELLKEISSNPKALEKVAREKYFMKKDNEDVYVFEGEGVRK